ncbi:UNKNOWN [Stylonychia lemnae]|uniref:Leucine Rich Repeat family protein n=1 Tax=Stylonychia lemnae TaxID=5949 RepID=A0A077ZWF7_STYLE|nr:UNKNOWN [Stylonychia lemnae]|eukprot:CDW74199.1 UNKNOWN [Stylonychia lemnae]
MLAKSKSTKQLEDPFMPQISQRNIRYSQENTLNGKQSISSIFAKKEKPRKKSKKKVLSLERLSHILNEQPHTVQLTERLTRKSPDLYLPKLPQTTFQKITQQSLNIMMDELNTERDQQNARNKTEKYLERIKQKNIFDQSPISSRESLRINKDKQQNLEQDNQDQTNSKKPDRYEDLQDFDKQVIIKRDTFKHLQMGQYQNEEQKKFQILSGRQLYQRFLKGCDKQKILPNPMRVFDLQNSNSVVLKSTVNLGTIIRGASELRLQDSNLSSQGAVSYLKNMDDNIETLDLSKNPKITLESYKMLKQLIENPYRRIRKLNLEGNKCGDKAISQLQDALSNNNLTDKCAESIKEVLKINNALLVLLLHWNFFKATGAIEIFDGLKVNDKLQVFDISNNQLGFMKAMPQPKLAEIDIEQAQGRRQLDIIDKQCALTIGEAFRSNNTLIHVDLSNNGLSMKQCKFIHRLLKYNHTILGLHMTGNSLDIDAKGFLSQNQSNVGLNHIHTRFSFDDKIGKINDNVKMELRAQSNCWICEGWTQVKFEFRLNEYEETKSYYSRHIELAFLQLSFENYQLDQMKYDPQQRVYFKFRMIPPGKLNFNFAVKLVDQNQTDPQSNQNSLEVAELPSKPQKLQRQSLIVPKTDMYKMITQSHKQLDDNYIKNLSCHPRDPYFEMDSDSEDDEEIQIEIKDFLKLVIVMMFLYLASQYLLVTFLMMNNLFQNRRETYKYFADGKYCKLADIDVEFVAVNAFAKVDTNQNPERQLRFCRYEEFIDMITHSGVVSETFGSREIGIIFNLSMMTQIDELQSERYLNMYMLEFQEAIARVAERVYSHFNNSQVYKQ